MKMLIPAVLQGGSDPRPCPVGPTLRELSWAGPVRVAALWASSPEGLEETTDSPERAQGEVMGSVRLGPQTLSLDCVP